MEYYYLRFSKQGYDNIEYGNTDDESEYTPEFISILLNLQLSDKHIAFIPLDDPKLEGDARALLVASFKEEYLTIFRDGMFIMSSMIQDYDQFWRKEEESINIEENEVE